MAGYAQDFGGRRGRYGRDFGSRGRGRRYERGFEIGPVWGGGSDIGFEQHWTRGPGNGESRIYPRRGFDLYW